MATTVLVKRASSLLLAMLLVIGYSEAYHLAQQGQVQHQPAYDHNDHHGGVTGHFGNSHGSNNGGYHHQGFAAPQQYHQPQQQVHHFVKVVHPVIDHGHVVQQAAPAVHYPKQSVTGHFDASAGQYQQHNLHDYNHGADEYDLHDHHSFGHGHAQAGGHQHLPFHH